jgi:hypothetical protein
MIRLVVRAACETGKATGKYDALFTADVER